MKKIIVILAALLLFVQPALAWNGKGHEVVAYIAYQQLTPATRTKVNALLKLNPCYSEWSNTVKSLPSSSRKAAIFMLAATWPDKIKFDSGTNKYDCQPGFSFVTDGTDNGDTAPAGPVASQNIGYTDTHRHKYWHFVDQPFSTDGTATRPAPSPNALDEILTLSAALASGEPDALKSYDLVWLEHLVGDVHQPLHDTSRFTANHPQGDQGGNLVLICTKPKCSEELHAYWDGILGEEDLAASIKMGKQLTAMGAPSGADVSDPHGWVADGLGLAKANVYIPPISDDEPGSPAGVPDKTYHDAAKALAETQVRLAGYRLANLLNQALGGS